MSNWSPVPGEGNKLRREMHCYGKPSVLLHVSHLMSLDGFDYVAIVACKTGPSTLICKAKATSVVEAKVIADALGKYVRHQAMRKARKDARIALKLGSVERELVNVEQGGANRSQSGEALWKLIAAIGGSFTAVIIAIQDPLAVLAFAIMALGFWAMREGLK